MGCSKSQLENNSSKYAIKVREIFTPMWSLYLKSSDGGWKNNDLGRFAWDDSFAVEGLVRLFQKTKDSYYIELAFWRMQVMYENTDNLRSIEDTYRENRSVKLWSTPRYTNGSYHAWNVHTRRFCNAPS